MTYSLTNGFRTTLNGAMNNSQTTATLTSSTGAPPAPFIALIVGEAGNTDEIILVGAISGTALSSITRAFEPIADGTQTASAHSSGATIEQVLTVQGVRDLGLSSTTIGARTYKSTTQAIAAASGEVAFTFDVDRWDTDNFHDTGSNTSRFTIPAGMSGKYAIGAAIRASAAGATGTYIAIKKNGSDYLCVSGIYGDQFTTPATIVDLVAGDYVELYGASGSGTTTFGTSTSTNQHGIDFWIAKVDSGRVGKGIGARVSNSSNVALTSGSEVYLTFDTEDFDTDGFHDIGSNTGRLTIPTGMGGKYLIIGNSEVTTSAGTNIYSVIRKNGTTRIGLDQGDKDNTSLIIFNPVTVADLSAGDYVEFGILVGASSKNAVAGDLVNPTFIIMRLDSNATGVLASGKVTLTSGDITTTSNTFVDATGLVVTLTTGARRCLVSFSGNINNSTASDFAAVDFTIDGTRFGAASGFGLAIEGGTNANIYHSASFSVITDVLSAGSHTFQMQLRRSVAGTAKINANTSETAATFSVQELPDSGALVAGNPPKAIGSTLQRLSLTSGDISFSSTVTTMTELSSSLRLSIAAQSGDVLQIGLNTIAQAGATGEFGLDSATIVSSAIVHQVSAGTRGIGHGYGGTGAVLVAGTLTYVVQSGDISGGTVTVSPTYINSGTTGGKTYADSTYGLTYWVINLGH